MDAGTLRVRLHHHRLAGAVGEEIVGGEGGAEREVVHQGNPGQLLHGLLQAGAAAEKIGEEPARVDRCLSRGGGGVGRVLRVVEQGAHEAGGVDAVHQDGLAEAQHRHACVAVEAQRGLAAFLRA